MNTRYPFTGRYSKGSDGREDKGEGIQDSGETSAGVRGRDMAIEEDKGK